MMSNLAMLVVSLAFVTARSAAPPLEGPDTSLISIPSLDLAKEQLPALYELVVQYTRGAADECPVQVRYVGTPSIVDSGPTFGQALSLSFDDFFVATNVSTPLTGCFPSDARVNFVPSDVLSKTAESAMEGVLGTGPDKRDMFLTLLDQPLSLPFYVSLPTEMSLRCPESSVFGPSDTFFFISTKNNINIPFAREIRNGGPRSVAIPLVPNMRHFVVVRRTSMCIYRANRDDSAALTDPGSIGDTSPTPTMTPTRTMQPASPVAAPYNFATPVPSIPPGVVVPLPMPTYDDAEATAEVDDTDNVDPTPEEMYDPQSLALGPKPSVLPSMWSEPSLSPEDVMEATSTAEYPTAPSFESATEPSAEPSATPQLLEDIMQSMQPSPEIVQVSLEPDDGITSLPLRACFPANASVLLASGEQKPMSRVHLGDSVAVSATSYAPVVLMTHADRHARTSFVALETAAGPRLRLSPHHYIALNGMMSPARAARAGDVVQTARGPSRVMRVSREYAEGLYNPQTSTGEILVDGVVTSCYTEAVHPAAAHALLAPVRMVLAVVPRSLLQVVAEGLGRNEDIWNAFPRVGEFLSRWCVTV